MKFSTVATAVLLGLLTGIFAMDTEPTSNQLTFTVNNSGFINIHRFNDERVQPIRLVAKGNGLAFTYAFRSDGRLTSFRVTLDDIFMGVNEEAVDERFRVDFNAQTGDILGFIPTEFGMPASQDPPAPFACDDCEEVVRDDVCDSVDHLCDLLEPGLLTNNVVTFALDILCDSIQPILCVQVSAEEVCSETCVIQEIES